MSKAMQGVRVRGPAPDLLMLRLKEGRKGEWGGGERKSKEKRLTYSWD